MAHASSSSSAPSGVVTLAFGSFALDVGAHYWNIQDDAHAAGGAGDGDDDGVDVDWRVEYVERDVRKGARASYVPRVVMFDAREGARARHAGADGGSTLDATPTPTPTPTPTWGGRVEVCRAPVAKRSAFAHALARESRAIRAAGEARKVFDDEDEDEDEDEDGRRRLKLGAVGRALEASSAPRRHRTDDDSADDIAQALIQGACALDQDAEHWSDFLKVDVDPARSLFALAGTRAADVDDLAAFSGFGDGLDWIDTEDRREDVRDAIRYWVETCDALGGFHVACEDSSGFGGVCARAMEDVKDEYARAPAFVFSVNPPRDEIAMTPRARRLDMLNAAFASTAVGRHADLYCPLAADGRSSTPGSRFRASAACALAMDTITTPWRLKKTTDAVGGMSLHDMVRHMTNRAPGSRVYARVSAPAPSADADADAWTASFRGVSPNEFERDMDDDDDGDHRPFAESFVFRGVRTSSSSSKSSSSSPSDVVAFADARLARELFRCPRARCATRSPASIPLPFPKFFPGDGHRSSVPIATRLTSGASSARALAAIESNARRASRSSAGRAALRAWSLDGVEFDDACESLLTQAHAFAGDDDEA